MSAKQRTLAVGWTLLMLFVIPVEARAQTLTPREMWEQPGTRRPPPPPPPTRFGAECAGVVVPTGIAQGDSRYTPAIALFPVPDFPIPDKMFGAELTMRYLIRASGEVDSVQVLGAPDAKYARRWEKKIRSTAAKKPLHPAVFDGCAVDSWYSTTFTINR